MKKIDVQFVMKHIITHYKQIANIHFVKNA